MKLNMGLVGYDDVGKTFAHGLDWNTQGAYFFSRVVQHGKRRAEEAGFAAALTSAIAQKQDWVAQLAATGVFEGVSAQDPWQDYANRLLAALPKAPP